MMPRNLAPVLLLLLLGMAIAAATEPPERQLNFDYEGSRQIFWHLADDVIAHQDYGSPENRPTLRKLKIEYSGHENDDLTIDALIIPAKKKKSLVIQINSGIHGLEAPTGSYLQQSFITKCLPTLPKEFLDETTFVVTHTLNPWGFKNANRFNANNVDLNRNCGGAKIGGEFDVCDGGKPNKEYATIKWLLDRFVHQEEPISLGWCKAKLGAAALVYGGRSGPSRFLEKALRGQTEDPNGIYFAGSDLQPECRAYEDFSKEFYEGEGAYPHSLTLTWHTGYGATGQLQLMGDSSDRDNPGLVDLLKNAFVSGELQQLDLDPSFKTCNDENVWLRRVEPDREPKGATGINGYLTAEIGGAGGLDSICAILMSRQSEHKQQMGKPLFKDDPAGEKEFREQVFRIFNPTGDNVDSQSGRKTYRAILDEHANYTCEAIKTYMREVLARQTEQPAASR
jgi:uncharacterized protein DUF2817